MSYSFQISFTYDGNTACTKINTHWVKRSICYAGYDMLTDIYNSQPSVFIQELADKVGDLDNYKSVQYRGTEFLEFWFANRPQLISRIPIWMYQLINESVFSYTDSLSNTDEEDTSAQYPTLTIKVV